VLLSDVMRKSGSSAIAAGFVQYLFWLVFLGFVAAVVLFRSDGAAAFRYMGF
jgi:hypothetical protein